ncbi:hypothetical protein [Streptomyces bauhiniae]|uniref:Uncharacterized protein n=1 Tax=Streptomyces bauhiniae TaxID=2340725 RepID=A0A7K3QZE1_9ACTN|nr:hypothetical protein [Streptomyces bauhiniae]
MPIEVRWAPADRRLADHPENVRRAQPLPAPRDAAVSHVTDDFPVPRGRRVVVLGGTGSGKSVPALSAWGRFAVARVWLALTGRLPWRLMAFLEDAHRRGVLRRSGACFEFRHLRLQSHLAGGGAGVRGQGGPVDGAWEQAPPRGVPGRGSGQ